MTQRKRLTATLALLPYRSLMLIVINAKKLRETVSNHIDAMALPSNESIVDEIRNIVTDKKAELQTIERQVEELERASTIDKAKFLKFALNYVDDLSTRFFELPREKQLVCKQLVFFSRNYD